MVFVEADRPAPDRRLGHPRDDDRDVTGARDHGVLLVGAALARAETMDVRIGDDFQSPLRTPVPEPGECIGVQNADAGVVSGRIEFVVID